MTLLRKLLAALSLCVPLASFAAPSATDLDPLLALTPDANVFESNTWKHATVQGALSGYNDVAWYAFTGRAGQRFFADHDDASQGDTLTDSVLSLFDANGTLLAVGDDSDLDPGSNDIGGAFTFNAFLGTYTLPSSGLYYLALSAAGNGPDLAGCRGIEGSLLQQPGSEAIGGTQYAQCSAQFAFTDNGSADGSFMLHVSLSDGTTQAVPEPGALSLVLAGLPLAGLVARRRRR